MKIISQLFLLSDTATCSHDKWSMTIQNDQHPYQKLNLLNFISSKYYDKGHSFCRISGRYEFRIKKVQRKRVLHPVYSQPVEFTTLYAWKRQIQSRDELGRQIILWPSCNTVVMNSKIKVMVSYATGLKLIILGALQEFSYFLKML